MTQLPPKLRHALLQRLQYRARKNLNLSTDSSWNVPDIFAEYKGTFAETSAVFGHGVIARLPSQQHASAKDTLNSIPTPGVDESSPG